MSGPTLRTKPTLICDCCLSREMLRIVQLEALERSLARSSEIALAYERGEPTFPQRLETWLLELETLLQNVRLPAASSMASLKSTLTSARDGAFPAHITVLGRPTKRKRVRIVAAEALRAAVELVQHTVEPERARFREAERIAAQLVAVARANGVLRSGDGAADLSSIDVQTLAAAFRSSESTAQAMAQLEGLAGPADAVIVLDRVLAYGLSHLSRSGG